jgi:hypothetical protein
VGSLDICTKINGFTFQKTGALATAGYERIPLFWIGFEIDKIIKIMYISVETTPQY